MESPNNSDVRNDNIIVVTKSFLPQYELSTKSCKQDWTHVLENLRECVQWGHNLDLAVYLNY